MVTPAALSSIRIRPIRPGDRNALMRFYEELSPDSLSRRFHGASIGIVDRAAVFFCGPDHEHREGLVAVLEEPGSGGASAPTIVGHLSLEPSGAQEVEIAVAVADAWQRHGIGRRLLVAAMAWAERHGIERLRASMQSTNVAILGLLRSMGHVVKLSMPGAGVVDATIDLPTVLRPAA
jgi:GNAT superfamily N-acetyltransferase